MSPKGVRARASSSSDLGSRPTGNLNCGTGVERTKSQCASQNNFVSWMFDDCAQRVQRCFLAVGPAGKEEVDREQC